MRTDSGGTSRWPLARIICPLESSVLIRLIGAKPLGRGPGSATIRYAVLDELPCGIAEVLKQTVHGSLRAVREMWQWSHGLRFGEGIV